MGSRGRVSSASLTVLPTGERVRPSPPKELTGAAAEEWKAIVERMPADWFPRETHPMLMQLCRLVARSHQVDQAVEKAKPGSSLYLKILRAQMQLSDSINKLSTKMRISQQTQHDQRKKRNKPKDLWGEDKVSA